MNKLVSLIRIQLMNFWLQGNSKSIKKQLLVSSIGLLFAVGVVSFYALMAFRSLPVVIYPYIILFVGIITLGISFFTTLSTAQTSFFEFKDFDLLRSLPIQNRWVMISKFASSMLQQWSYAMMLLLPVLVIYVVQVQPGFLFVLYFVIGMLCLPAGSIALGVIIALFFRYITAGTRFENLLRNLSNVLLMVVIFWFSFQSGFHKGSDQVSSSVQDLSQSGGVAWYLSPAKWFAFGTTGLEGKYILYLVLLAIVSMAICASLYFSMFESIHARSMMSYHVKNFKASLVKQNSVTMTLLKREVRTLITNFTAAMNMFLMPVLGIFGAIYLAFFSPQEWVDLLHTVGPEFSLVGLYFACVVMTMPTYSATCINTEGTRFWIIRSLPISEKQFLLIKHFFGLMMTSSVVYLLWIVAVIRFEIGLNIALVGVLLITLMSIFSNAFALDMNLFFPKMVYDDPAMAIKKSGFASVIGMMVPYFFGFALVFYAVGSRSDENPTILADAMVICAIFFALSLVCELVLWVFGPSQLRKLG